MYRKLALSSACLGVVLACMLDSRLAAQEDGKDAAGVADAYLALSKPGPEHAKLRMRAGNWKVVGTMFMAPGAPPLKTEATASVRPVMGGRYFRESYTGEFFGKKFTGIGFVGYDKGLEKYVSTWIDSMSTGVMRSEGTADKSGDVITFVGEYFDPMRKQTVKQKYVMTLKSRKTHSSAMFEIAADGSENKIMELVYTRAPKAKKGGKKKAKDKSAPKEKSAPKDSK